MIRFVKGAYSVGFHLFYKKSWPYFQNAIMESGSPTGPSILITNSFFLLFSKLFELIRQSLYASQFSGGNK